jgi:UDPglucose 6-dehydrogenase
MTISVFGLGFVGLTTALGFAHYGSKVYGIDVNRDRTELIQNGEIPFYEPEMKEVLNDTLNTNFFITDDIEKAVSESDCIFYCVGTPCGEHGSADLRFLFQAIDTTLQAVHDNKYRVLVVKSTVPPSTTGEKVVPYVKANYAHLASQIGIANNPEFLREGRCWEDFIDADRIVLGCDDKKSAKVLKELYSSFRSPVFIVSHNTGEFIKYLSNTLLATMISYSNEMSLAADKIGQIDISQAFRILHMDKRWNHSQMASYVYPGCGYGGFCLPKDTNAFYTQVKEKGFEPQILKNVIELNEKMPNYIARKIMSRVGKHEKIGILGLSFKPFTDDVRDTPVAKVIDELIKADYRNLYAFDPVAMDSFQKSYSYDITYQNSIEELYEAADIIVITTAWPEFKKVLQLGRKTVVDCRYML